MESIVQFRTRAQVWEPNAYLSGETVVVVVTPMSSIGPNEHEVRRSQRLAMVAIKRAMVRGIPGWTHV